MYPALDTNRPSQCWNELATSASLQKLFDQQHHSENKMSRQKFDATSLSGASSPEKTALPKTPHILGRLQSEVNFSTQHKQPPICDFLRCD